MATTYDMDHEKFDAALEQYLKDQDLYLEALASDNPPDNLKPPIPPNPKDFMIAVASINEAGKGMEIPDRPDVLGIKALETLQKANDELAKFMEGFIRVRNNALKAAWEAAQDDARPKAIERPDDFHDVTAWKPALTGGICEVTGEKIIRWEHHSAPISFTTTKSRYAAMIVERGCAKKALIQMASDALKAMNEPQRRYDALRKAENAHLRARLVSSHGEEQVNRLYRVPRADNEQARALSERAQKSALAQAEKDKANADALAALDALPDPTPPAPPVEPTTPPATAPSKGKRASK